MSNASPALDPRWTAVVTRAADPSFFYAVATTGVYCRPSCGARTPRPENVSFHPTTDAAERAGYRACKRCKPNAPPLAAQHATTIAELCRFIEASETIPSLDVLAGRAGMSPFHLHRVFKALAGVTPRAYAAAERAKRLRAELGRERSVTAAAYGAGFGSSSRLHAASMKVLGMTPSRWKRGAASTRIRFATGTCSLGCILVATTERGVCAILLGDDPGELRRDLVVRFPRAELSAADASFAGTLRTVIDLVDGTGASGCGLPLDVRGTAFQERVWQELAKVAVGETATYTELAARIGAPGSVRAVAGACAANPLAVAVPCHRVVRSDGSLAGYRWGIERKRVLLAKEAAAKR